MMLWSYRTTKNLKLTACFRGLQMALDLSDCAQVGNSVIRAILQGCPMLENMRLDRCHRITDSAFDVSESPFHFLFGCLSLQAISLQVLCLDT